MSVAAIPSPFHARNKRFLDDADVDTEAVACPLGSAYSKRLRLQRPSGAPGRCGFSPSSEGTAQAYAHVAALRALFPEMNEQTLSSVLVECGNNIDAAIKRLTDLRLSTDDATVAAATAAAASGEGASPDSAPGTSTRPVTPSVPAHDEHTQGPQTGEQWVDYLISQMSAASGMDDARHRAATVLQNFERFVKSHTKEQESKEKVASILHENGILKKAVLLQNKKLAERSNQEGAEISQLRLMLSQYQEQVRKLEMHNFSLTMHLQQATSSSHGPGMTHHRNPDIF